MPISPSTILYLHYATDNENLLRYHIGIAQTKIQLSPHPRKAPSQPQSYSHLTYILVHQCLLFLIPHHTHLLGYANFAIKPIVECFSTIFTYSPHSKYTPLCLIMQKIFVTYFIAASRHGKDYHFQFTTNQPPQYIVRMSCTPHQNHHILLARTNHHCSLALYFCTNLPH